MKRSEVLREISELLRQHDRAVMHYKSGKLKAMPDYSITILNRLEQMGMRPPVSGDLKAQLDAVHFNKWEKE